MSEFRTKFLTYDELTAQVHAWAEAHPDVVRVSSIGKTDEGRDLWLLTLGLEPDRIRPAAWVDGNMHGPELCGSSVALAIAEDVIRLHTDPEADVHGLPGHVKDGLREILFYVVPRISPDGAEAVLASGRYVRSNLRDTRANQNCARWVSQDLDGDGLSLVLRKEDPAGEFVEDREITGLMVPRTVEDEGPYYKIYPEGIIENFDGHTIPPASFMDEFPADLNRNFPWFWAPEHDQVGAGAFPTSEPESRTIVEFTSRSPHIFSWLNLHTFGCVFIRPLGHQPDNKLDPEDLAVFGQIEKWGEDLTGYPMVSGFEDFTYEPDKPLHGDLTDYAYHQRGAIAYVCELWDLFHQIGAERGKRFVDRYTHLDLEDLRKLARFDREHNQGRVMRPWKEMEHPQLGTVEVGGIDPRVGMWNPPYERILDICRGQSAAYLHVAAMAPRVRLARCEATPVGPGLTRVEITVENHGYLPTYVLSSAKKLEWNEPLTVAAEATGCMLVEPAAGRVEIGHLDGWGRGRYSGSQALYYTRSRGNTSSRRAVFMVKGQGELRLRVGACRVGWIDTRVTISA